MNNSLWEYQLLMLQGHEPLNGSHLGFSPFIVLQ